MDTAIITLLLAVVGLFFFSAPVCLIKIIGNTQLLYPAVRLFRCVLLQNPKLLYAVPSGLLFLSWMVATSKWSMDLSLAVASILYFFVPTSFIVSAGHGCAGDLAKTAVGSGGKGPDARAKTSWIDFIVILMLWLPLEYGATSGFFKNHFGKLAHVLPWGSEVVMALFLFSAFRRALNMKICLPTEREDFAYPVVGLLVAAPVLIILGRWLDFIPEFSYPGALTFSLVARRFIGVWLGVALPEEILFRSLIQNWLMSKFGESKKVLLAASLIFGLSHLNNGPQALPNWRYAIIATVAGFIYGKIFQKTTSVCSSATLHAAVNTIKHFCFGVGRL